MKKYTGKYLVRKNNYPLHCHLFSVQEAINFGIEKAILLAKIPDLRLEHRDEYAQWFLYIGRQKFYELLDELIEAGELVEKDHLDD
jgi:hypothetical protein